MKLTVEVHHCGMCGDYIPSCSASDLSYAEYNHGFHADAASCPLQGGERIVSHRST